MSMPAPTPTPADPPTPAPPTPTPAPTPDAKPDDETLGAGGVAALKAEREARKLADDRATAAEAQLQAIADADKTEAEKQQAALEKAQADLAKTLAAKTRAEVAAKTAIPMDLLAGPVSSSEADVTAFAEALIAFRGAPTTRYVAPKEGTKTKTGKAESDEREFVKNLFGQPD